MDKNNDLLRKLKPIIGKKAKALWFIDQFADTSTEKLEHENLLNLLSDKYAKTNYQEKIRLPPPIQNKLSGDYYIGKVIYPDIEYSDFGLREHEFIKHIFITGMTGTGKTNLGFQLLHELNKKEKPFLIFDWKRNYRDLKQFPEFKNIKIIRIGDPACRFKFNPLIPPPGVLPKHWIAMLVDVIKHAFFVGHGVEYYLRKEIDYLYERFGIYVSPR